MSAAIAMPDHDLQKQANYWTVLAEGLEIVDLVGYEQAAYHLQGLKALQAEADATFDPIIRKAHDAHREALAQKKRIIEPLERAEATIKRSMGAFAMEQQRKREEEERQLREASERLAAEAREILIEEAEAAGATLQELEPMIEAPLNTPPVLIPRMRIAGIVDREVWKAEVNNLAALVKFVATNPRFMTLLRPDTVAINSLARSLKSTMNIPGIRVWSESNIAVTGRKTP